MCAVTSPAPARRQPLKHGHETRARRALRAANVARDESIPWLGLHPARHTFGALMRGAGISRDDQEEYLGHSRPGVTSRYTNSVERDMRDADNAKALATYLHRVSTRDRIEQLDEPVSTTGSTTDADALARELVDRFGEDVLERVAALVAT